MSRPSRPLTLPDHLPGQAMVEFAVAATALFILLFAIIEMGIVIYDYNMVCSGAREGVRYAMVHCTNSSGCSASDVIAIQNAAINSAPFLSASNITPTLVTDPNDGTKKDAKVTINYPYTLQIPLLSPISLTLVSTSKMMLAR